MNGASCSDLKHNVDFQTSGQLPPIAGVQSAQACQDRCDAEKRCQAWTWGEAPNIPSITQFCWLKQLAEGEFPKEISKTGIVSGMTCRQDCKTLDGVDLGTSASLPPLPGVTSAEICQAVCRSKPGCAAWTWGKARNSPGLTDHCFMKKLSPGERANQFPKAGVVSGFACSPSGVAPPAGTAVAPVAPSSTQQPQQRSSMLYCFTLALPFGKEADLLRLQHEQRAGIFACDDSAVYSNASFSSPSGLHVSIVQATLLSETVGELRGTLNRGVYSEVWKQVLSDGTFWLYDWTVKVDPDTVFFPIRLRPMLHGYKDALEAHQHGLYLNNCRFGLISALEIFSSAAVQALGDGWHQCEEHFRELCSGECGWDEDLFADQCLSEVLQVRREYNAGLLIDERCEPPLNWQSCQQGMVAFHPLTSKGSFTKCLGSAGQGSASFFFK